MGKLQGKVAVITGGTTGIGLASAQLFVKECAYVFITGRRQKELDDAVQAIGSNVTGVQGDIAKPADLDSLYERIRKMGRIDPPQCFGYRNKAIYLLTVPFVEKIQSQGHNPTRLCPELRGNGRKKNP
jgi:enoyl-[acyl-carrier-protein] reductase (NADH)